MVAEFHTSALSFTHGLTALISRYSRLTRLVIWSLRQFSHVVSVDEGFPVRPYSALNLATDTGL